MDMVCLPNAVPCMLEYEGLQMGTDGTHVPKMDLMNKLDEIVGTLEQANVDHSLIVWVLKQVSLCACVCVCMCVCVCVMCLLIFPPPQLFYYINGHMLNTIMLRREMCHRKYGRQIRSVTCLTCLHDDVFYICCPPPHSNNLMQLKEWCEQRELA